jgi:hypothetical protein
MKYEQYNPGKTNLKQKQDKVESTQKKRVIMEIEKIT